MSGSASWRTAPAAPSGRAPAATHAPNSAPGEAQVQRVDRQLVEVALAHPRQRQAERGFRGRAARCLESGAGDRAAVLEIAHGSDFERPEVDVLRRDVGRPRRQSRQQAGQQPRAARHDMALVHRLKLLARFQYRHARRWRRRDEVGIEHVEHAAREAGALAVDLEPRAGGQEGDAVEQPFDIGVGAGDGVERQVARDGGMHVGEFGGELPDMRQLILVILKEDPVHPP